MFEEEAVKVVPPGVEVTYLGGVWRVTRPLHPGLRPFVYGYAGFWNTAAVRDHVRLVPAPRIIVMITLSEAFSVFRELKTSTAETELNGSVVTGLADAPRSCECEHVAGKQAIRLDLTPLGAYQLLALPMAELTNKAVELMEVLGPQAQVLMQRLTATRDWSIRFDLLEAFLLDRITVGPVPAPEVRHAWHLLSASVGRVPVAQIAAEVGWSQRHLIRQFTNHVGVTPKKSARILRFDRALSMLGQGTANLAEVSAICGFSDQAHLCREFQRFANISPSLFAAPGAETRRSAPEHERTEVNFFQATP